MSKGIHLYVAAAGKYLSTLNKILKLFLYLRCPFNMVNLEPGERVHCLCRWYLVVPAARWDKKVETMSVFWSPVTGCGTSGFINYLRKPCGADNVGSNAAFAVTANPRSAGSLRLQSYVVVLC